jgi:hypothetical protein
MRHAPDAVTVYAFEAYDASLLEFAHAPYKATLETIKRLGGRVLLGTDEEVSASELNSRGEWRRVATGWGDLAA